LVRRESERRERDKRKVENRGERKIESSRRSLPPSPFVRERRGSFFKSLPQGKGEIERA
jgi:hypothetical protein